MLFYKPQPIRLGHGGELPPWIDSTKLQFSMEEAGAVVQMKFGWRGLNET